MIVIDSRSASLGQGLIVCCAAELAKAGCDVDEIILRVDQAIAQTRVFALLGDLRYAVRGGRVPRSKKLLADLLRLDPVLDRISRRPHRRRRGVVRATQTDRKIRAVYRPT